ncbi:protein SERAC1 isoform X2 [Bacillus rossius redtenbacheri]|uniref:protein SERAC1 isoform X2 n=1 Tax=Bacillus rossius redtenbacheri TaxID=93214 RepID=UPI002FDDD888
MSSSARLKRVWPVGRHRIVTTLKQAVGAVIVSGVAWIAYEVRCTYTALSSVMRPEVMELKTKRSNYIFINDPNFGELFETLEESDRARKRASVFWSRLPSPVGWLTWWRKTLAWRLLSVAQTGDLRERRRAVHLLAQLGHLTDSDCRHLAQACDARTAVGLARISDIDLRFFLPPPYAHLNPSMQELIDHMRNLLLTLESQTEHLCVEYFLSKAFPEIQRNNRLNHQNRYLPFDMDVSLEVRQQQRLTEDKLLRSCVENLLHHCAVGQNAKDLVTVGALPLLMAIYRRYHDSLDMKIMLCKILSYVSIHDNVLDHVFMSGWVGVLAESARSPSMRLSAPAQRALVNLDRDEKVPGTYHPHVYLLHPTHRQETPVAVDVVFVHGLLGSIYVTWRQRDRAPAATSGSKTLHRGGSHVQSQYQPSDSNMAEYLNEATQADRESWSDILKEYVVVMSDIPIGGNASANGPFHLTQIRGSSLEEMTGPTQCWPRDWLPQDCSNVRVIGISYDTALSFWAPICPVDQRMRHLDGRSEELLEKMKQAGLGARPIVWVAHSMGGLIVKNMLVKAWQSGDEELQRICRSSRAVAFYSVPHRGSPLAALRQTTQFLLWPSIEVQELRQDSPGLLSLHDQFLQMLREVPLEVVSFTETQSTLVSRLRMQFNFVPQSSADPGVGEFYEIPQDHLCICKPANQQSFLYQKLLSVIQKYCR